MTVKEAIEYIISKSKDDESLLTDTRRFWTFLLDLAPEHRKELNVIKRSLDSDFLNLCFKDKEEIKRRVLKMKFRLENQGLDKNWIDFIIDYFFTPLGWKPPKDEEETPQVQPQQPQNQQVQKQQTQNQQINSSATSKKKNIVGYIVIILIGLFVLFIISNNSNKKEIEEQVTYSTIETADVGDYIKFGNYPQTADGEEKPIEWRVLAKEDNRILIISRYGLDAKRFDDYSNVWESSEIRKWLNKYFYNKAFTEQEKKNIKFSNLSDVGTSDNVFFLSCDEAEKYFANKKVRLCKATDYAKKNGAYVNSDNGYSYWWLRSPSPIGVNYACVVRRIGDVNRSCRVNRTRGLARPALWINL